MRVMVSQGPFALDKVCNLDRQLGPVKQVCPMVRNISTLRTANLGCALGLWPWLVFDGPRQPWLCMCRRGSDHTEDEDMQACTVRSSALTRLSEAGPAHHEICKYCQMTSEMHGKVSQHLVVQRTMLWMGFPMEMLLRQLPSSRLHVFS